MTPTYCNAWASMLSGDTLHYDAVVKRWLVQVFLYLLLGAIINVAVAWRYGARWGFPEKPLTSTSMAERNIECVVVVGVTLREKNLRTGSWESATWSVHQEMEAGLPFRSMGGARIEHGGTIVERDAHWEGNLPLLGRRSLLLRPIWPGFAINTVFYAAILWLLFAGPFVLRRRGRIRRGLCPKCAYDLRGTPEATSCPESGAAVLRVGAPDHVPNEQDDTREHNGKGD